MTKRKVPETCATDSPNATTIRAMEDATSGKGVKTFTTVDEFFLAMEPWWKWVSRRLRRKP